MVSPWGEDIPAELKAALSCFDDLEKRLREVWLAIMNADGGRLFYLDLYVQGAIKRSLSQIMGMRLLLEHANLTCARALLRMQIDTAMRLSAAWLVQDPHGFARQVIAGKRVDQLKSEKGHRLTDKYLADMLSQQHPWVRGVYDHTSGYVHLSSSQFMLTVERASEDRTLKLAVGADDTNMPIASFVEVAECFEAATEIVLRYLDGWRLTKANPGLVAELRKRLEGHGPDAAFREQK